jgi:hypothetical protein
MVGLSRSDAAAEAADGVIHTAFNHDFSNLKQTSEDDRKAIETLCEVLAGSDRQMSRRRRPIFSKRDFRVSEDDNNRARSSRDDASNESS